jgi:hypothetical protein
MLMYLLIVLMNQNLTAQIHLKSRIDLYILKKNTLILLKMSEKLIIL